MRRSIRHLSIKQRSKKWSLVISGVALAGSLSACSFTAPRTRPTTTTTTAALPQRDSLPPSTTRAPQAAANTSVSCAALPASALTAVLGTSDVIAMVGPGGRSCKWTNPTTRAAVVIMALESLDAYIAPKAGIEIITVSEMPATYIRVDDVDTTEPTVSIAMDDGDRAFSAFAFSPEGSLETELKMATNALVAYIVAS